MKKIMISMILVIAVVTASAQRLRVGELGSGNREALATDRDARMTKKQLFDFGWQFTHSGKTVTVDLPHDWDIFEGPHSGQGATGTGGGWFEAGKGEYRASKQMRYLRLLLPNRQPVFIGIASLCTMSDA